MNRKSIKCLYDDIGTEIVRIRMSLMGLDRSGAVSHDSHNMLKGVFLDY